MQQDRAEDTDRKLGSDREERRLGRTARTVPKEARRPSGGLGAAVLACFSLFTDTRSGPPDLDHRTGLPRWMPGSRTLGMILKFLPITYVECTLGTEFNVCLDILNSHFICFSMSAFPQTQESTDVTQRQFSFAHQCVRPNSHVKHAY